VCSRHWFFTFHHLPVRATGRMRLRCRRCPLLPLGKHTSLLLIACLRQHNLLRLRLADNLWPLVFDFWCSSALPGASFFSFLSMCVCRIYRTRSAVGVRSQDFKLLQTLQHSWLKCTQIPWVHSDVMSQLVLRTQNLWVDFKWTHERFQQMVS
jgi:hypothetical protein